MWEGDMPDKYEEEARLLLQDALHDPFVRILGL